MNTMLVVVFDTEAKANEGKHALSQFDGDGTIDVYAHAVIVKNADGSVAVTKEDDTGPAGALVGVEIGSLISILGGPAALAVGMGTGLLVGSATDLHKSSIYKRFVEDVSQELERSRFALVAEIQEESTAPVDTRMVAIGGKVFRRALADVKHTLRKERVAAVKAKLAKFKAKHKKDPGENQ